MSYARMSDESDVYVYREHKKGEARWVCCACKLHKEPYANNNFRKRTTLLKHLLQHTWSGHLVPKHCWERLVKEINGEIESLKGQLHKERMRT